MVLQLKYLFDNATGTYGADYVDLYVPVDNIDCMFNCGNLNRYCIMIKGKSYIIDYESYLKVLNEFKIKTLKNIGEVENE